MPDLVDAAVRLSFGDLGAAGLPAEPLGEFGKARFLLDREDRQIAATRAGERELVVQRLFQHLAADSGRPEDLQ